MQDNRASLSDGDHWSWAHVRHSAVKFLCNALVCHIVHTFQHGFKMPCTCCQENVREKNKCLFSNLDTSRDIFVCLYLL